MTPTHREWAGVSRYMASDAGNNTTASTISETMIERLMAVLLFRLAPRAGISVKRSNRALCVTVYPFPPGNAGYHWKIIATGRLNVPACRVFRDVSAPSPFPRPFG